MPRNGLPFPVGVWRKKHSVSLASQLCDPRHHRFLAIGNMPFHIERAFGLHNPWLGRQLPNVTHGRLDYIAAAKEICYLFRFGGRLYHNQCASLANCSSTSLQDEAVFQQLCCRDEAESRKAGAPSVSHAQPRHNSTYRSQSCCVFVPESLSRGRDKQRRVVPGCRRHGAGPLLNKQACRMRCV